ncbi:MAG: DNA-directed RNA polymerase subunit beta' [Acidobacteria bacterium]|nr:MAG: DNA-directed RNA polymerase subunit beta' [Acidobacteriota bacterium]REJ98838.1 MAG: DNA-directed RNA polymerase subunit beta' [Acidobacteriota bacterium]REK16442.1 MAG: DNA-directed RNA polymerase subunit beta' [Acidobacteriota bacterium]REK44123.1 MAG: DNA-directed RNA polymerase subunit beta' [Acidobacteriota bacterium]
MFRFQNEKTQLSPNFEAIRISLASPEKIRSWSHGEVTKPETINYRTFKPERDGLFCARIFGPVSDWECLCGKYKRMKHRGVICDKCGVEVTQSKVRRERLGHIELASPCSHVWFFKGLPSRIGHLLDITLRDLEKILYFELYIVIDPGDVPDMKEKDLLTDEQYREKMQEHPGGFVAKMGAEAIKELLMAIEIPELVEELRTSMKEETSQQKKLKFSKRLKVANSFFRSQNKPEWMILDIIPVIPPELRPLVPLDGGRFATSDLNDLYRRVINRNNRLKKLMELRAPEVIVRNEKRMLQEAVDALFDNGRRGRVLRGANNRPLKSLSGTLKGKQGRFRQNLLGKRVDYSGRSVIVVGPELSLHQCGLPKKMALELFKPFIYNKLEKDLHAATIKQAREMVERQEPIVWDILEEVIRDHPVLLNRAPTLHRLGIQAFEPVLVEGKAIKIHPLVCTAFNADFDGDQMAVHIPLSAEAQIEASVLMLASNNLLSPASGQPIAVPSQDIVLGCYYLTLARDNMHGENSIFSSVEEVLLAYDAKSVDSQAKIKLRWKGDLIDLQREHNPQDVMRGRIQKDVNITIDTTVGRVIFNDRLTREGLPFVNGTLKKKGLQSLVNFAHLRLGHEQTVALLDDLKALGFLYATKAGVSIGIDDMVTPESKAQIIEDARKEVDKLQQQYEEATMTDLERSNKVTAIWSEVTDKVAKEMFRAMDVREKDRNELNPILVMADSGARGSEAQIRQLAGMRGLMAKPSGEIIETPITANFREGLNVLQYFISTHGARKGLADTALKTADSGYLTRRLVDVAQDVIVSDIDCGTLKGIWSKAIVRNGEEVESLRDRIVGCTALDDILDPVDSTVIVKANQEIDEDLAAQVQLSGLQQVKIRSPLTCEARRGICVKCYGRNLAMGRTVEIGEAVGVIAAQSIGEPGTQLTMRTFHVGGTARLQQETKHVASLEGKVVYHGLNVIQNRKKEMVNIKRQNAELALVDDRDREVARYSIVYGAQIHVKDGQQVKEDEVLATWDPFTYAILTEADGTVKYQDLVEGKTVEEDIDKVSGQKRLVVKDSDEKNQPRLEIRKGTKSLKSYQMPIRANLLVEDGEDVKVGDIIAKIPRETTKNKDIVGGLPRVVELFEARRPSETAVMSEIDGTVQFGPITKGKRKIIIVSEDGVEHDYDIPRGTHISVQEGDRVKAGEPLMDGPLNPHDILRVLGMDALQEYLVNEIQEVYRLQGVNINDKHIEVIVRQMLRWVKIKDVGDTDFLLEEQVDRFRYEDVNQKVREDGNAPASAEPLLLGITKASLSTDSFISAASFQETTRVLTEAAISGRVDYLRGLKENVIMGRLIPAGTGMKYYRNVQVFDDPTIGQQVEEEMDEFDIRGGIEGQSDIPLVKSSDNGAEKKATAKAKAKGGDEEE